MPAIHVVVSSELTDNVFRAFQLWSDDERSRFHALLGKAKDIIRRELEDTEDVLPGPIHATLDADRMRCLISMQQETQEVTILVSIVSFSDGDFDPDGAAESEQCGDRHRIGSSLITIDNGKSSIQELPGTHQPIIAMHRAARRSLFAVVRFDTSISERVFELFALQWEMPEFFVLCSVGSRTDDVLRHRPDQLAVDNFKLNRDHALSSAIFLRRVSLDHSANILPLEHGIDPRQLIDLIGIERTRAFLLDSAPTYLSELHSAMKVGDLHSTNTSTMSASNTFLLHCSLPIGAKRHSSDIESCIRLGGSYPACDFGVHSPPSGKTAVTGLGF